MGVCGSIACYKAVELASLLTKAGALVDVVMTPDATRFVGPITFQSITHRKVRHDLYEHWEGADLGHVSLAEADLAIVAPASFNTIAKLAHGFSDNLLTATLLGSAAPLLIAPAGDRHMYAHPATTANLATLHERGVTIIEPESGRLASGHEGKGRLPEPATLLGYIRLALGRDGDLAGKRTLITAAGTQEPLDPVRYIGNRSSGKMGFALAQGAIDRGASVTLITGPTALKPPVGALVMRVSTATEMADAVLAAAPTADVLIMAAAVADYRPLAMSEQKIKKGEEYLTINLTRTTDILGALAERADAMQGLLRVGFAAETENLLANAADKLRRKKLHLIVANDAATSIGSDDSSITLLDAFGSETLPTMPKAETARRIIDRIVALLKDRDLRNSPGQVRKDQTTVRPYEQGFLKRANNGSPLRITQWLICTQHSALSTSIFVTAAWLLRCTVQHSSIGGWMQSAIRSYDFREYNI